MKRADSAFDETFRVNSFEDERNTIRAHKTTSSRPRKSKHTPAKLNLADQTSTISTIRPSSDKPTPTQRPTTEPRRKSITTTSSNSGKSRRRGHASAPSSRRTSCTIIDPSRPTRHYRINSSQTLPTPNRDIDDVLALHFRSCSLFPNADAQAKPPSLVSPTISGYGPSALAEIDATPGGATPQAPTLMHDSDLPTLDEKARPVSPGVVVGVGAEEDTTMHWMLPETRRTQYEKIDRANTGVRGLVRRLMPRCVSGPAPLRFYEGEKEDAGSVRRYRMDVSDEEDEDEGASVAGLKGQRRRLERSTTARSEVGVKRYGCF